MSESFLSRYCNTAIDTAKPLDRKYKESGEGRGNRHNSGRALVGCSDEDLHWRHCPAVMFPAVVFGTALPIPSWISCYPLSVYCVVHRRHCR